MINIKELRIGNFIELDLDIPFAQARFHQIMLEDFVGFHQQPKYIDKCSYISLSQKLLEKLGFEIENFYLGTVKVSMKGITGIEFEVFVISDLSDSRMKYLHQLQNRFYSIVGVELFDVVAYNYYLQIFKDSYRDSAIPFEFKEFLNRIVFDKQNDCYYKLTKYPDYNIGDLPPNLFK